MTGDIPINNCRKVESGWCENTKRFQLFAEVDLGNYQEMEGQR